MMGYYLERYEWVLLGRSEWSTIRKVMMGYCSKSHDGVLQYLESHDGVLFGKA